MQAGVEYASDCRIVEQVRPNLSKCKPLENWKIDMQRVPPRVARSFDGSLTGNASNPLQFDLDKLLDPLRLSTTSNFSVRDSFVSDTRTTR